MLIRNLIEAMDRIAPLRLAEEWDNVGLIVGSPDAPLRGHVLLTIDLTEAVADEAAKRGCGAIVAYHPPIFAPLKRITGATVTERVLMRVLASGIAIHSPHTALDAAAGGLTDWLADGLLGVRVEVRSGKRKTVPMSDHSGGIGGRFARRR